MKPSGRTASCTKSDARTRLSQARSYVDVSRVVIDDESMVGATTVAASLAVLAGIAASDAACCHLLGRRPRGQDHRQAMQLLRTIPHRGDTMAKLLGRLLVEKDSSHYGLNFVGRPTADRLVRCASELIDEAAAALER